MRGLHCVHQLPSRLADLDDQLESCELQEKGRLLAQILESLRQTESHDEDHASVDDAHEGAADSSDASGDESIDDQQLAAQASDELTLNVEPKAEERKALPVESIVPTRGAFFMHDDRSGGGKGRGRGTGGRRRDDKDKDDDKLWTHDKFEELMKEELPPRRGGKGKGKGRVRPSKSCMPVRESAQTICDSHGQAACWPMPCTGSGGRGGRDGGNRGARAPLAYSERPRKDVHNAPPSAVTVDQSKSLKLATGAAIVGQADARNIALGASNLHAFQPHGRTALHTEPISNGAAVHAQSSLGARAATNQGATSAHTVQSAATVCAEGSISIGGKGGYRLHPNCRAPEQLQGNSVDPCAPAGMRANGDGAPMSQLQTSLPSSATATPVASVQLHLQQYHCQQQQHGTGSNPMLPAAVRGVPHHNASSICPHPFAYGATASGMNTMTDRMAAGSTAATRGTMHGALGVHAEGGVSIGADSGMLDGMVSHTGSVMEPFAGGPHACEPMQCLSGSGMPACPMGHRPDTSAGGGVGQGIQMPTVHGSKGSSRGSGRGSGKGGDKGSGKGFGRGGRSPMHTARFGLQTTGFMETAMETHQRGIYGSGTCVDRFGVFRRDDIPGDNAVMMSNSMSGGMGEMRGGGMASVMGSAFGSHSPIRPESGGLFTSEHMAQLLSTQQTVPDRSSAIDIISPDGSTSIAPAPSIAAQRRPTLELDGYSLSTTASGLSVLVPTGTRKVTIEAPP